VSVNVKVVRYPSECEVNVRVNLNANEGDGRWCAASDGVRQTMLCGEREARLFM
jgi:hypothetical protein